MIVGFPQPLGSFGVKMLDPEQGAATFGQVQQLQAALEQERLMSSSLKAPGTPEMGCTKLSSGWGH